MKKAKYIFPPPNKQKKEGTSYPKGILQGKKGRKKKKDHAWQVQIAKQLWTIDNNTRF